jgi:hypothetical protein
MLLKFEMTNGYPIWVNPAQVVTVGIVLDSYNFDEIEERQGITYRVKKFAAFPVAGHTDICLVPDGSGEGNTVRVLGIPHEVATWFEGSCTCKS